MPRILTLAFAAVFSAAIPAAAQQTSSAPPGATVAASDPARLAAAERLFAAMDFDVQIDRTMSAMSSALDKIMDQQLSKPEQGLPPDFAATLKSTMSSHLRDMLLGHRSEMKQGMISIYAEHFTVAELDRLAAMQSDPLMAKMRADMPQIASETIALSQSIMGGEISKMQQELKAEVAEYVRTHAKKP